MRQYFSLYQVETLTSCYMELQVDVTYLLRFSDFGQYLKHCYMEGMIIDDLVHSLSYSTVLFPNAGTNHVYLVCVFLRVNL